MENKEIVTYTVEQDGEFIKNVKRLAGKKKFRSLPNQIDELMSDLKQGKLDGARIRHCEIPGPCDVYKVRLPNPDANVGKSNGYRVIYLVVTEEKIIVLQSIYYKKEQETVDDAVIDAWIQGYFASSLPEEEE